MVILDSSTLILVAKMEMLDSFLGSVELPVLIPAEVAKECCAVKKSLDALSIQKALDESRIRVVAARDRKLIRRLRGDFGLGRGEAEAIVLALAQRAPLVGIDDKNGINACKLLGIAFTTAIAILIRMHDKGLLTEVEALNKLAALGKHGRYKQSILDDAKRKLEKRT
jgi:predicted nucleic acid-binding protein